MGSLLEKSLNFKRNVKINFDGGNLTSDSGLILYSEFDERIGFSRTVKDVFMLMMELIIENIQTKRYYYKKFIKE